MLREKQPFAEQIGETVGYVSEIFDRKVESIKISVAEKSATTVSGIVLGVILGVLGLVFSVFGLATIAFWIAGMPDAVKGFGIIAAFLLLLLILIFLLRNKLIVDPAVSKVIDIFFGNDKAQQEKEQTS